jgi:putative secretion ATPase (PEP-CTERM system associated)
MYEQFYGLSGPPFQIHPDPGFYFESKGHATAYQYLRFGAFQGEGFIVVTGEIGAGKTTLLRALLAELDPAKIVAAQIVSTQLEADDLLSAVGLAFGINVEGLSKARVLVTLEAYLATLATSNRRALLIVDEAQNLSPGAIEELRMLSNFQFGSKALLQSFLVGQPELRDLIRLPQMEQLRQRVLASCHLGPMEPQETRAYVEHRLRHVGWSGRPAFENDTFAAIHDVTRGVPRRINALCSRLLLSAFLESSESIDLERVRRVECEMREEISGERAKPEVAAPGGVASSLLCVAGSERDELVAAVLMRAFSQREDLPSVRLLRFADAPASAGDAGAAQRADHAVHTLACLAGSPAARVARASEAFSSLLDVGHPVALVAIGDGAIDLACAIIASEAGIPVVRVDAGASRGRRVLPRQRRRVLLDHVASLAFAADPAAGRLLEAEGVPSDCIHVCGSLAGDVLRMGFASSVDPAQVFRREGVPLSVLSDPAGYVLLGLDDSSEETADAVLGVDAQLRAMGWRVRMVWPVESALRELLAARCAAAGAGAVNVIEAAAGGEWLGLVRHARCLLTDSDRLRDEAHAMGVPCLGFDEAVAGIGTARARQQSALRLAQRLADTIASGNVRIPQAAQQGHAAVRIAGILSDWLLGRQDKTYCTFLERT